MVHAKPIAAAVVGFLLFLGGCATSAPGLDPNYRLTSTSSEGLVTGSVTYKGGFSAYRVHYQRAGGSGDRVFANYTDNFLYGLPPKADFDNDELAGVVFAVPLEPGDYEAYGWTIGSGTTNVYSTVPFRVPFKVEPGKMVYLGNFHFVQTCSNGFTVMGATLTYGNAIERDIPMFKAKFRNVADAPVAQSMAPAVRIEHLGGSQSQSVTKSPLGTKTAACP